MGKVSEALQEEEDPYVKGEARESFTNDQFFKCWSDFAAKLKVEGKKNALTIFTSNAPKLIGTNSYEVIVENKVQENLFRDERPNLLNHLRPALNNYGIGGKCAD